MVRPSLTALLVCAAGVAAQVQQEPEPGLQTKVVKTTELVHLNSLDGSSAIIDDGLGQVRRMNGAYSQASQDAAAAAPIGEDEMQRMQSEGYVHDPLSDLSEWVPPPTRSQATEKAIDQARQHRKHVFAEEQALRNQLDIVHEKDPAQYPGGKEGARVENLEGGTDFNKLADPGTVDLAGHVMDGIVQQVDSSRPSDDDPAGEEPATFSYGNVAKATKFLFGASKGRIVRGDPIGLHTPPSELAQPKNFAFTKDIRTEGHGEDNEVIGDMRDWRRYTRGPHDTVDTRVLDPTIPTKGLEMPKREGAIDDFPSFKDQATGADYAGANELSGIGPEVPKGEAEPIFIRDEPFRSGMATDLFKK